jgi:hypothetical protein
MAGNFRRVAADFVEDLPRRSISAAIVAQKPQNDETSQAEYCRQRGKKNICRHRGSYS